MDWADQIQGLRGAAVAEQEQRIPESSQQDVLEHWSLKAEQALKWAREMSSKGSVNRAIEEIAEAVKWGVSLDALGTSVEELVELRKTGLVSEARKHVEEARRSLYWPQVRKAAQSFWERPLSLRILWLLMVFLAGPWLLQAERKRLIRKARELIENNCISPGEAGTTLEELDALGID